MANTKPGAPADPVVETSLGKLRGARLAQGYAFLGIRYGVAERFRPPRPPEPHGGVADALQFGASAPQTNPAPHSGPPSVILAKLPRPAGAAPPARLPESEDCLYLNVWTSSVARDRPRPVMVWLHGGFFSSSSGSTVDGSALAARGDVVVVSLNHRLNAFGYTALGDSEFGFSANVGMLDIVAALEWVRENIAAFGGDPSRVTVMGTSGGGMKTAFLAASPRSRHLMHRAAIHSGPVLNFMEPDAALQATDLLYRELGARPGDVGCLLRAEVTDLLGAYHRVAAQLPSRTFTHLSCFAPVRDGELLAANPWSPEAAPLLADLPVLTGSNHDEMSFFMGDDPGGFALDDAGWAARVRAAAGERAGEALALYGRLYPHLSPSQRWIRFNSDLSIAVPTMKVARRKAALDGKVWRYRLDLASPALEGRLGATHTLETPLIFDKPGGPLVGANPAAPPLAKLMSETWVRFAQEGKVSTLDLPAYTAADGATLVFDAASRVELHADAEVFELLAPLMTRCELSGACSSGLAE